MPHELARPPHGIGEALADDSSLGHVYIGPANLGTILTIVLHSYAKGFASVVSGSVMEEEAEIPGLTTHVHAAPATAPFVGPLGTQAFERMGDQADPRTRGSALMLLH